MANLQLIANLSEPYSIYPFWVNAAIPFISAAIKGENGNFSAYSLGLLKSKEEVAEAKALSDRDNPEWENFNYKLQAIGPDGRLLTVHSYSQLPKGSIAQIPIKGPMMIDDQYCGPMGTNTIGQMIKSADASTNIKEIILDFDSPGGMVKGNEELANIITNTQKPTTGIYVMACSAAYRALSACDRVVATSESAICGSIGTMLEIVDVRGFYEENGIKFHTIRATDSSDKNEDYYQALEGNYELIISETLDPLNEIFTNAVRQNRSLPENTDTLTGKTFLAQQAIDRGLVDAIMSPEDILANMGIQRQSNSNNDMNFFQRMFGANAEQAEKMLDDDLRNSMEASETRITELETTRQEQAEQIETLTASLAEKDARITELEAENAQLKDLPAADHSEVIQSKGGEPMIETKEVQGWQKTHQERLKNAGLA